MQTQTQDAKPLGPFHNPGQMTLGHGGPIVWSRVSEYFTAGKFTVKVNGAVAKAAESITVDALEHPVKANTTLDFGAEADVEVELSGNEAIGQTVLSVVALPGPLPAGAILNFGAGENIVELASAAIAGATTITITEALTVALETGDTATYQGGRKLAEVQEDADAGAVTLVVAPVQFAIADNAEAIADYTGTGDKRRIPAGTVMARASTNDGLIPRRDGVVGDGETAVGFLVSDADEKSVSDAKSGYGIVIGGTSIYENLCPDADGSGDISSTYKTELVAAGVAVPYIDWTDDRLS